LDEFEANLHLAAEVKVPASSVRRRQVALWEKKPSLCSKGAKSGRSKGARRRLASAADCLRRPLEFLVKEMARMESNQNETLVDLCHAFDGQLGPTFPAP